MFNSTLNVRVLATKREDVECNECGAGPEETLVPVVQTDANDTMVLSFICAECLVSSQLEQETFIFTAARRRM